MAEVLLRNKIEKAGLSDEFAVSSAGITAWAGQGASREAAGVMASRGLSLERHRSRQLTPEHVKAADLILAMTESHGTVLKRLAKETPGKIHLLAEYAGGWGDVADPAGGPAMEYELCADELERLIEAAWKKILRAAGK